MDIGRFSFLAHFFAIFRITEKKLGIENPYQKVEIEIMVSILFETLR